VTGFVMPEKAGNPNRFITFNTDISERRASEEVNQQLLNILNESPDLISTSTIDGTILYLNPAGFRMLGMPEDTDLSKLHIPDFHPAWALRKVEQEGIPATLAEGSWQGETAMLHSDGHEVPVFQTILVHRDREGKPGYLSTICPDISRQKADEENLIAAKLASEAANLSKSTFLANMSHEIRTPMNGIIGMTHLALQTDLNDNQRNYISKAHYSAENLLGILDDILDFSKMEAGKLELEQINFQLGKVIDNYLNVLQLKAEEKSVQLTVDVAADVHLALVGDPLRLGQVLINLGGNALKFSDTGDTVNLQVSLREDSEKEVLLLFSLHDQGIGMSEEHLANLFTAFNQADSSTTRKYGGTGLGLSISRNIVQLMGGEIWVESDLGKGSTFYFTARLGKHDQAADSGSSEQLSGPGIQDRVKNLVGSRILLVEDNDINQELVYELLSNKGIEVETADNGQQALEMLVKKHFDGVLMDCQMPVMDGYEATRRIRQQAELKDLPIIALTANTMKGDREKVLDVGMNDHIAKPIDPDVMFQTMAKWISPNQS